MEKFLKYTIQPVIDKKDANQAKFEIAPLERGMGNTLGNALRRTLLFDIPGASLFAIKINDVAHEFQGIDGIKEDVTQIILNLKGLVLKIDENAYSDEDLTNMKIEQWPVMKINVSGKKEVHGSDIELPAGFDIVNPDLYICSLTDVNAKLEMSLYATRGRGFTTFSVNHERINTLGIIATDSDFSPVLRVAYSVDSVKISKHQTSDRLVLDVITNGSVSPSNAVAFAAKALTEHLTPLIEIDSRVKEYQLMQEQIVKEKSQTLSIQIENINLSVRSYNCLKRAGIQTIEELTNRTRYEIEHIKNLGRKSMREIVRRLTEYGLNFREPTEEERIKQGGE
ncbi:MAG: DNA-directed RNA polymerase subunit alpha [Candidatus Malacoplasma girerdii]|nr:MAG: DNA-directed RNA polymerase subunit alpha [Candidatus Malacoplasma girerdii]